MVKIPCLFGTNQKAGERNIKNIVLKCFTNIVIVNSILIIMEKGVK